MVSSPRPAQATRAHRDAPVVGMIGGGQLACMIHRAAVGLGVELVVLAPSEADVAVAAGAGHVFGHGGDLASMFRLAQRCDLVIVDHEAVDPRHLEEIAAAGHLVRPRVHNLELAQDRAMARRVFADSGFPVPRFEIVTAGDTDAVDMFASQVGWPLVVKTPTRWHDGRRMVVAHRADQLPPAHRHERWLLEERVTVERQLAVILARRPMSRELAVYPMVETTGIDGVCHELTMPAAVDDDITERAYALAISIAQGIDAVGIITVELFLTGDGTLLVNEISTRPHISGHATVDAAITSQFENHLRAVLDWPLGDVAMTAPAAATVLLVGGDAPFRPSRAANALLQPATWVHLYDRQWAPGRRLGHVTATAPSLEEALATARAVSRDLVAS